MEHVKSNYLTLHQRLTAIGIKYWTLICLLASIDILGPLATDAYLPSLPHITSDLDTSPSWTQFTILSYAFIMAISSLCGGILSDKYGRRSMTLFGLLIFILGGIGCTFSFSIWILNLCRFIQAIGGGISSIITSSVARDVFLANERMKILGILSCIRPIGIGIAPMIGGWISSYYGWRMVFFIISMFATVILLISFKLLPETKNKFFVNFNKIRILQTETNVIGNIGILNEESNNQTIGVIVSDTSDEFDLDTTLDDNEWSPAIPIDVNNDSQTIDINTIDNNDIIITANTSNIVKIACNDSILMSVSWIIAFRMVGVFIFLNEFPYVSHYEYNYSQSTTGLMIGIGSIFTILGASVAILLNRESKSNIDERSSLLFKLSPKNAKLTIMRLASIASLIACILFILPPIIMHYSIFLQVLEINSHINHLNLINIIYTSDPWYFLLIPFCILTFSQGLFIPPALVVVLEPYPHIAATISAILQFWRIILPTITLIVITQCLSFKTNNLGSIIIHLCVGICSFLCFVIMYGCISGHDVRLRMCGWQSHINQTIKSPFEIERSNSNTNITNTNTNTNTYGTNIQNNKTTGVTVMHSVDISTTSMISPNLMDMSNFNLYNYNNPVATNASISNININNNNNSNNNTSIYDPFATSIPTMQF